MVYPRSVVETANARRSPGVALATIAGREISTSTPVAGMPVSRTGDTRPFGCVTRPLSLLITREKKRVASPVVLAMRTLTCDEPISGSCAVSGAERKSALCPGRKAPNPPARLSALPNPGSAEMAEGEAPAGASTTWVLVEMLSV
ncbi:unannotated protein [freshwater metagenome]|uniref:Unannotated protein n=1 Tax=freshwater metagenome TaxID=449393 RepID=A0A6J6Q2Y8_9ZZZZ